MSFFISDDALCKCNCKNTTPSSKKTCTATSPPDEAQSSAAISPNNIPPQVDATPKHPGDNNGTCQTPGKHVICINKLGKSCTNAIVRNCITLFAPSVQSNIFV